MPEFYKIHSKSADEADISIYGDIGESFWGEESTSASGFKKDLDKLKDVKRLNISVNSGGGSVFDGMAIFNMLKRHKAKKVMTVDGLAASAASLILMAGDVIKIPKNAYIMIHRASTMAYGNVDQLKKTLALLENIDNQLIETYVERTGKPLDEITEMLNAETWLNGKEAVEMGFADELEEEKKIAACVGGFFMPKYQKVPETLAKTPDLEPDFDTYQKDFELMKRRLHL